MVKVTYTNIQTPVLTIDDAIQKSSIVPTPQIKDIVVGNADRKSDGWMDGWHAI